MLAGCLIAGCDSAGSGNGAGNSAKPAGDGLSIDWGSGSVQIGGDGSVDVKAPGVDVNRKPGEGVQVRAPNVDVNVAPETGVQVNTPGVNVDADWKSKGDR